MSRGWLFQQDNDPKHTSAVARAFLESNKVTLMQWPSQSPDLNPIEHLWDELERRVAGKRARNADEKFELLRHEWENIGQDVIDRLIASMPNRMAEVIRNNGYSTRY